MNSAIVAFLLGLGTRLNVRVIGYLPISELAIVLATPLLLSRITSRNALRPTRLLLPLCALWLGGTVASDLFNQTELSLAARGLARPAVLLCCIPFCSWFMATDTARKLLWFTIGGIPSLVLSAYVLRGGVADYWASQRGTAEITWENHWCGLPLSIALVVTLLYYKSKPIRGYLATILGGLLNVYMGSRSAGATLICGAGACFTRNLVAMQRIGGQVSMRRLSIGKAVVAVVTLLAIMFAVLEGYKSAAQNDLLGPRAKRKYEAQAQSNVGLLSGRADVLAGMLAISESPILGYGSWPLDKNEFYVRMCELIGAKPDKQYYKSGYPGIPTHSHIVQAWVQSGIFGGIFWIYVAFCLFTSIYKPMLHERELRLWASTMAINIAWAVLFSPISDRLTTALVLTVLLREMMAASKTQSRSPATVAFGPRPSPPLNLGYERLGA
jgi:hypothetical protein